MKQLAILGAGESGMGAAMLASQRGYAVWVSDAGEIAADKKVKLEEYGVRYEEKKHSEEIILKSDLIIKSPGISPRIPVLEMAAKEGIAVIDELEFAQHFSSGKIIAVTGTNGKTTTTLLIYHLMKEAGMDVGLAGNVGKSWAGQLLSNDHDWWVIECSSFQIDGFLCFKPTIGILTNITPDHLDRYEYKIEKYIDSKFGLFKNIKKSQAAILNADDSLSTEGVKSRKGLKSPYWFSTKEKQTKGAYQHGEELIFKFSDDEIRIPLSQIPLKGEHNIQNALCASLAALLAGVSAEQLKAGFQTFKNAPHRMELIREIDGLQFVNDSKGTNVESTAYALASYDQPLIWIAGGVDKGNDYSKLLPVIGEKVKCLICLGKDNEKLKTAFQERIADIRETQDIQEAVKWGQILGMPGDVVLLSPACASFDLFKNYEDRGEQFRRAVESLKPEAIA